MDNSNFKKYRLAAGYHSAREFANAVNIEYTQYTRYESGKAVPTFEKLVQIASALNCTVDELIGHTPITELPFDPGRNELTQLYAGLSSHDQAIILNMARFMAQNNSSQTNIQDATITGSTIITGDGNTVNNSNSGNDYTDNRQNITINNYSND